MIPESLKGKSAWVTGASRGIGRAIVHAFAEAGAHVVLGARSVELIEQDAAVLKGNGRLASAFALDVSDPASCLAFVEKAREASGIPDILVNCAGMGVFRPVTDFREDEFEKQYRVNVFGTFYMTRFVVPLMKQPGSGHIINISSLAGESTGFMGSGYFSSKWAVHGFTNCIREELRDLGIRVTLVCPGSTDTRFHYESHPGSHQKDQSWMVAPEDIAKAVLLAASLPESVMMSKVDVRPLKKG